MTRIIHKYRAYSRLAVTKAWHERFELLARMALLPLFLGIFDALWTAIAQGAMPIDASPRQMVWYLAVTQWILFSSPHPEFEFEQQVRRGDVAYQLARPLTLLGAICAEGLGTLMVNAIAFGIASFGSALLFTGALPVHPARLLLAIPLGLVGAMVLFMFHIAIGFCAFWFRNIAPFGWIWSKATFVLGGLMLPLPLYPDWLKGAAESTPFAHALYGPASYLLDAGAGGIQRLLVGQLAWLGSALCISSFLHRSAIKTLAIDGG